MKQIEPPRPAEIGQIFPHIRDTFRIGDGLNVAKVAQNVMNFVATDLGIESPIQIVWFVAEPEDREYPDQPASQDEGTLMSTFSECLLREGIALGINRIGGFTPFGGTSSVMIRADVFNPGDSSRDRLRVTIAHEMRHIWQNLNWKREDRADGKRCEDDALAYQSNSINRYLAKYAAHD